MLYVVTGPLGSGKSLMATQRLIERAAQGRRVAANYHVDFSALATRRSSALSSAALTVVPAKPSSADLEALGRGGPVNQEDKAGLLVIDEAGMWLNARDWDGQDRRPIVDWLLVSRKLGWDVLLLVQTVSMLDKQIREIVELVGRCRRMDRVKILGVKMPRVHMAAMRFGTSSNDVVVERWFARGTDAFKCYDTNELFQGAAGLYQVLPATLTRWRYVRRRQLSDFGAAGVVLAFVLTLAEAIPYMLGIFKPEPAPKQPGRRGGTAPGVPAAGTV